VRDRQIPAVAYPDEGAFVARQAAKPGRVRRREPRALPEEEQLPVGSAEGKRPGRREERDVHRRRRAAGGEREVVVHNVEGAVAGEDAQERAAAAAAPEPEGRRPARRLPVLLQPERVRDVEPPAFLGPAACRAGRRRREEEGSEQ
jgi:hypothetical protein